MLGCELVWDEPVATQIREFIEESIGGPCPCRRGERCKLLPRVESKATGDETERVA